MVIDTLLTPPPVLETRARQAVLLLALYVTSKYCRLLKIMTVRRRIKDSVKKVMKYLDKIKLKPMNGAAKLLCTAQCDI